VADIDNRSGEESERMTPELVITNSPADLLRLAADNLRVANVDFANEFLLRKATSKQRLTDEDARQQAVAATADAITKAQVEYDICLARIEWEGL